MTLSSFLEQLEVQNNLNTTTCTYKLRKEQLINLEFSRLLEFLKRMLRKYDGKQAAGYSKGFELLQISTLKVENAQVALSSSKA